MAGNKLILKYPVLVEGRYDKIKLSNLISSPVIVLGGFSVFNNSDKVKLVKKLAENDKLIVLTDSDNAGMFIRNRLKGYINRDKLINIYIPRIRGKEKRKTTKSKENLLGVEGIDGKLLRSLLEPYAKQGDGSCACTNSEQGDGSCAQITSTQFYLDGFSGGENSAYRRKLLTKELSLPENLTSKGLLEAINLLISKSEYEKAKQTVSKKAGEPE